MFIIKLKFFFIIDNNNKIKHLLALSDLIFLSIMRNKL